jgi:cytochrome c
MADRLHRRRKGGTFIAPMVAMAAFVASTALTAADIELGRYLATECMTCHRSATSVSTIPNIFGLEEAHTAEVLKAYRAQTLPNPVMQTVASRLKDDEIEALAAYFAATKRP